MTQNIPLDLSLFEDVPSPRARAAACRLSFSAGSRLSQNEAFQRALQGTDRFHLKLSPDGRVVLLFPDEQGELHFGARGARIHRPLGEMLEQRRLKAPVAYQMSWEGGWAVGWDGMMDCAPTPPSLGWAQVGREGGGRHETAADPLPPGDSLGGAGHRWAVRLPRCPVTASRRLPIRSLDRLSACVLPVLPSILPGILALRL